MEDKLKQLVDESEDVRPGPGTAAVAIVTNNFYEVLLVKRIVREGDPWSGHVAFPGGKWRPEDDSLIATALRELAEETGLRQEDVEIIGPLKHVSPANMPSLKVKPIIFSLLRETNIKPGPEVEKVFWAPLKKLQRKVLKVYSRHLGRERLTIGYVYGDEIVWGMTARLIDRIINVV